jgi:hypothetical protein
VRIKRLNAWGDYEFVEITNLGAATQCLQGWTLQSYGADCGPVPNQVYAFPNTGLPAGETKWVVSGPLAPNIPPYFLLWTTAYIWNDDSGRADLRATDGTLVTCYAYGRCSCP